MKKIYFAFLLLPMLSSAQSPVIHSAGFGEEWPSSACLACPGTDWNNPENITNADDSASVTGLDGSGFCFMSTCFFSRFLYAHNFKFSIPADATIDSIFVEIKRAALDGNAIYDSIVQLVKSDTLVGDNLQSAVFWPKTLAYEGYGHNNPLWGTTWLPSELNDSASGVALKVMNLDTVMAQAGVDHIQMTVYYSTSNGIFSVTSSPSDIEWINSPGEIGIKFIASSSERIFSKIYNSNGQEISYINNGQTVIGQNYFQFPTEYLAEGMYFLILNIGDKIYSRKIVVLK